MEVFKNAFVVWVLDGKRVKPGTPGAVQVRKESSKWDGKVKDSETGRWQAVPLSRDKGVARRMLAKLIAEGDAARAGLIDPLDRYKGDDVREYLPAFKAYLKDQGDGERHIKNTASVALQRLASVSAKNHFYRANRDRGRVFKTEFLLSYLSERNCGRGFAVASSR